MARYGIILLDDTEVIIRVYETTEHEWKLFHYHSSSFVLPIQTNTILEIIGNFFITDYAQHVADWKICSRHHPKKILSELSRTLAIAIEDMSPHREQELLCKGMFTELW